MGISKLSLSRELNHVDAPDSAASLERLKQLLERVALVTRPGGAATLLFALGRIASSTRWLHAGFSVEITGDDGGSKLEIYVEDGENRERVVEATTFAVPVDELVAALDADPTLIGTLRADIEPCKVLLTPRTSGVHDRL